MLYSMRLGQPLKNLRHSAELPRREGRGQVGGCCRPAGEGGCLDEQGWGQPGSREADVAKTGLGGRVSRTWRLTEWEDEGKRMSPGL